MAAEAERLARLEAMGVDVYFLRRGAGEEIGRAHV